MSAQRTGEVQAWRCRLCKSVVTDPDDMFLGTCPHSWEDVPRTSEAVLCAEKDPGWPDTPACQRPRGHVGAHQSSEDGAFYSWPGPRPNEARQHELRERVYETVFAAVGVRSGASELADAIMGIVEEEQRTEPAVHPVDARLAEVVSAATALLEQYSAAGKARLGAALEALPTLEARRERAPRRRAVSEQLLSVFEAEARRWLDKHVGLSVDSEIAVKEVEELAREFAKHFIEGANAQAGAPLVRSTGEGSK